MTSFDRRHLLRAAGAAAAVACASPLLRAQGLQSVKVTQAVSSLAYIQSFVAQQNGYFKSEGLDTELINTGGGGPDVQIVLAGKAEFTVNDGAQVFPAVQQGQKLNCVMALLNRSIVNVSMRKSAADKLGITASTPVAEKIRRMKGLRIGVTKPGALTWQMARYNFISAGMNPDNDAEITGMGDAPSLAAALRQGNLDAIYISVPIGETLVGQGVAVTLIDNSRGEDTSLPSFLMEGLWATPDYIKANRPVVTKMVSAYRKASGFLVQSTPEDIAKALKPVFSGLTDEVLLEGVRRVKQAVSATGTIDAALLENTQKVLEVNGVMKKKLVLADVFDSSFIKAA
ncbi:MAG: ABC transporter substrate-binding protein [Ramlibacter sp.]